MSKNPRRWVTVENSRSLSDSGEKRKPSVFERLGSALPQDCPHFMSYGNCMYGSDCRFRHPRRSERKERGEGRNDREKSPVDLRHKVSRKRKGSESDDERTKVSHEGKKKKDKVKSTIVVQQSKSKESDDSNSEVLENEEDDYGETLALERKRRELEKALRNLEAEDDSGTIEKQSSQDEVSEPPPTPPSKRSSNKDKHSSKQENLKRSKQAEPHPAPVQKKSIDKKAKAKAKKKSYHEESSEEEQPVYKEKEKKKKHSEKKEKSKKDKSFEEKDAKSLVKIKKKVLAPQQQPLKKKLPQLYSSSSDSSSSSSSSHSSSSDSSSEEDDYQVHVKKKATKPDRPKKSTDKKNKERKISPEKPKKREKEKGGSKIVKVKGHKSHSSPSHGDRHRHESPVETRRSKSKKRSVSPRQKHSSSKTKRSLSPSRESKKRSSPPPRTKSPTPRTQSLERSRRGRSQETRSRKDDSRRRRSPSLSETRTISRHVVSPEPRGRKRTPEERSRDRRDSPEVSRRNNHSIDRQQTSRRAADNSPDQRTKHGGRDRGRENRDQRHSDRRAATPESNDRSKKGHSPVRGHRGGSTEEGRSRRHSPGSRSKTRNQDEGRKADQQSDRHRLSPVAPRGRGRSPVSPVPPRGRGRSPAAQKGGRDRRAATPDEGKSHRGGGSPEGRRRVSPAHRDESKGRRGRSPVRQQPEYERGSRGQQQQDSRDHRDTRETRETREPPREEHSIQDRILNMAGYQADDRRVERLDRRGERLGRDTERSIERKSGREDSRDIKNTHDRDLSRDTKDRRGERQRLDESVEGRRGAGGGRDQWEKKRLEERGRPEERRYDRHGQEIEPLRTWENDRRSDSRKRGLDEERGRSPPMKQRRENSPSESMISSSGSKNRRDEQTTDWESKGRPRDRQDDRDDRRGREMREPRDVSQKRHRSASLDNRHKKRQRGGVDLDSSRDRKTTPSHEESSRTSKHPPKKPGPVTEEDYSDVSELDTDSELLNPNGEKFVKKQASIAESLPDNESEFDIRAGRDRHRVEEKKKEERGRRSPSRSSIGSRHSFREDRHDRRSRGEDVKRKDDYRSFERSERDTSNSLDRRHEREEKGRDRYRDRREDRPDRDNRNRDQRSYEKDAEQDHRKLDGGATNYHMSGENQASIGHKDKEATPARDGATDKKLDHTDMNDDEKKMDMEYDEISDDDLDELIENAGTEDEQEENKTKGVVDTLDIDWASLCNLSKPKPTASSAGGSVLKQFTGPALFARIGLSKAFAGKALFEKIQAACQKQLEEEQTVVVKEENAPAKKPVKFEFLSDVAQFHSAARARQKIRSRIMSNIGPYRRALCARKDLEIRRHLCKVTMDTEGVTVFPTTLVDQDLYKQSIQMLRQERSSTEEKNMLDNTIKVTS